MNVFLSMTLFSSYLFPIIRLAIGTSTKDIDLSIVSPNEWNVILQKSIDQGVGAIILDGLQKVTKNDSFYSNELESIRYELLKILLRYEISYKNYVIAINSLVDLYSTCGIETMILKGYGLSLNYPEPSHRPTGDIDVYLTDCDRCVDDETPAWIKADKLLKQNGISIDYSHHHHSVFYWRGQMVENHYDIENRYSSRHGRDMDDLLKSISCDNRKCLGNLYLPSPTFNGIFLISHTASHFAGDRITVRHLLDWALFVNRESNEIDWQYVVNKLNSFGLVRFLSCMNALSIDYLGISDKKFPKLTRDTELENRVLQDILFPSFDEKGSGFFFKLKRLKANLWKRNLVSSESFLSRMAHLTLSHMIKPSKRKFS